MARMGGCPRVSAGTGSESSVGPRIRPPFSLVVCYRLAFRSFSIPCDEQRGPMRAVASLPLRSWLYRWLSVGALFSSGLQHRKHVSFASPGYHARTSLSRVDRNGPRRACDAPHKAFIPLISSEAKCCRGRLGGKSQKQGRGSGVSS